MERTASPSTAPTFRAVTAAPSDPRAELRFTYLGPTATTRALGSGAIRQQLGLKLRAQDPCNLVYVMWRIEPEPKLVVSIKRNPGQRTSRECGNRGYKNIKPTKTGPLPALAPSSSHVLAAEMVGDALVVKVHDVSVWEGALGADALALSGPIGVRTDNVRIEAQLSGPGGRRAEALRRGRRLRRIAAPLRKLLAASHVVMPWKNGGGTTTEVAKYPEGSTLEDFAWRISMARIEAAGPFSRFEGIDRSLALIDGDEVALLVDGAPVSLTRSAAPYVVRGRVDRLGGAPRGGPWKTST